MWRESFPPFHCITGWASHFLVTCADPTVQHFPQLQTKLQNSSAAPREPCFLYAHWKSAGENTVRIHIHLCFQKIQGLPHILFTLCTRKLSLVPGGGGHFLRVACFKLELGLMSVLPSMVEDAGCATALSLLAVKHHYSALCTNVTDTRSPPLALLFLRTMLCDIIWSDCTKYATQITECHCNYSLSQTWAPRGC